MEILETFDWDHKPSRSRYAKVAVALIDENAGAVKLKRGEDFPSDVKLDSVKGSVSNQILKAGRRAKYRPLDNDTLIVGLKDDEAPARKKKPARIKTSV